MHRLSIVIVTMNSAPFLRGCLTSIFSGKLSMPFEVIVVDNASTDGSVGELRTSFPQVRVISNNENVGFNKANNQGINASSGDLILLLNPDTKLREGALEAMSMFMLAEKNVAVVGPKILNGDGSLQQTGVSFPSLWNVLVEALFLDRLFPRSKMFGRHRRLYDDPDTVHDVDYLQGSCVMVQREMFEKVGLLDERFFMYFDELGFCYRCKREGWRITYVPTAVVTHYGGGGTAYYDEARLVHFHKGFLMFLRKHYGPVRTLLFRIALFLRAALRWILFTCAAAAFRQQRSEFQSRRKGYGQAMRLMIWD